MRKILLPIRYRILLFISNGFFLFSLLYLIASFLAYSNGGMDNALRSFVLMMLLMQLFALIRSLRTVRIIENASGLEQAGFIGGLKYSDLNKNRRSALVKESSRFLQLSLSVSSVNGSKRHANFYFVKAPIMGERFNYFILRNENNPNQMLLFNALPGAIRKYILKHFSDK